MRPARGSAAPPCTPYPAERRPTENPSPSAHTRNPDHHVSAPPPPTGPPHSSASYPVARAGIAAAALRTIAIAVNRAMHVVMGRSGPGPSEVAPEIVPRRVMLRDGCHTCAPATGGLPLGRPPRMGHLRDS